MSSWCSRPAATWSSWPVWSRRPFLLGPDSTSKIWRTCDWPSGELCLLAIQGSDAKHGDLSLDFVVSPDAIDISCSLVGAAPAASNESAEGVEADQLSEQILAALVDEHGRTQAGRVSTAWLRKRRKGPLA